MTIANNASEMVLAFATKGIASAGFPKAETTAPKRKRATTAKPKAGTTAKPKAKQTAADKEGARQTRKDIVAASLRKEALKVFKVDSKAKAAVTRARGFVAVSSAAAEHAIKLAGGKTELFRAAMAKAYGDDWHICKRATAETDSDKARALLIEGERKALQAACEAATMSGSRKPWSDAGLAQKAWCEAKALTDAGLDPKMKGEREEKTMLERIVKANLALYKAHQKNPSASCDKATAAMFLIGKALIECGQDLTQANLAGKN